MGPAEQNSYACTIVPEFNE
jgi:hypothetical protein